MFVGFEVSKSQTRASHHFHWDYESNVLTLGPNLTQSFHVLQTFSKREAHAVLSHCRTHCGLLVLEMFLQKLALMAK